MTNKGFNSKLNKAERIVWSRTGTFVKECQNFLGNTKAELYPKITWEFLSVYKALGCHLKLIFWNRTYIFFLKILEPDQMSMLPGIISSCWSIPKEIPMESMKEKNYKTTFILSPRRKILLIVLELLAVNNFFTVILWKLYVFSTLYYFC